MEIDDIDGLDDLERFEPSGRDLGIGRILVAVDTSSENLAALEAAADLAALLESEIMGLFVEDPDLVRLEELPTSRRITLPYGHGGDIERGTIQRELRVLARRAHDVLAQASDQRQVPWSFDVARGPVERELTEAAQGADLVVVESKGRAIRANVRMDSSTLGAARDLEQSVLFLKDGARPTHSIVLVYDGTPAADYVLEAGLQFAGGPMTLLSVLFPTAAREEAQAWRETVEPKLASQPVPVHYRRVSPESLEWLQRAVDNVTGDILIQSADNPILQHNEPDALIEAVDCPVFLVR